MKRFYWLFWACLSVGSTMAWAEEPAPSPSSGEAETVLKRYLQAVQTKKWAEAKKLLHPDTLKAIAERKRRLGEENHPMAPWYLEKVAYSLKVFKVVSVIAAANDTFVVETSEDNYQVEDKAVAEAEMSSYLVGRKNGKWYVVDKKRGETFTSDSIRFGYKNYFDAPAAEPSEAETSVP